VPRHTYFPRCWFAEVLGPPAGACDGQLVRAHLVPKQALKREMGGMDGIDRATLLWDARSWVWACGGPTGIGGHHGMFDCGRIAVPPEKLPPGLREYLAELGLEWMIERYFGRPVMVDR
jgi:hypothetical protein